MFKINENLKEMFQEKARKERFEIVKSLIACKHQDGNFVCAHIQKIKSCIDRLGKLGVEFPMLSIDMVLNSLSSLYHHFTINYNMNNLDMSLIKLHGMLEITEASLVKTTSSNFIASVLAIGRGSVNKKTKFSHVKFEDKVGFSNKGVKRKTDYEIAPNTNPKEAIYFYCQENGH